MTSLRIAVALPHLEIYGGIRRFLELGRVWIGRGHEVALLTPEARDRETPWLPFPGHLGTFEELRSRRWDVLLSPDPQAFVSVEAPGALRVFYAVLEGARGAKQAWQRADLVLANSAGMRRYLSRRGICPVSAVGGVNTAFFHPHVPDPRPARGRAGAPVQALVYGRTSRRRKGSATAVRAIELAARTSGIATELTLFDSPPGWTPESPLGRRLSIPHRWVLHPTQEELRALYAEADIFVSAERRAGWCNTAAEAMACGTAVVCTGSGTEDFAADRKTARVSRWPWAWLLARKIAPLLSDPVGRAALGARGRAQIAEFTWEGTAERIERAIEARLGVKGDG